MPGCPGRASGSFCRYSLYRASISSTILPLAPGMRVGGDSLDHDRVPAERLDVEPEHVKVREELLQERVVGGGELQRIGKEELLGAPHARGEPGERLLVQDALVGDVLVHDEKPFLICESMYLLCSCQMSVAWPGSGRALSCGRTGRRRGRFSRVLTPGGRRASRGGEASVLPRQRPVTGRTGGSRRSSCRRVPALGRKLRTACPCCAGHECWRCVKCADRSRLDSPLLYRQGRNRVGVRRARAG